MGSYCQLHEHTLHQWHEEKRQRRHQQSQEPAEARWAPFEQSMIYTTCCSQHTFAWTKREPTFPLYKGKLRKIEIAKSIKKNLSAFIIRQKYQYSIFKHFSTTTYHLPFCFWLFFLSSICHLNRSITERWDQQKSLWEIQEGTLSSTAHHRQCSALGEIWWWVYLCSCWVFVSLS